MSKRLLQKLMLLCLIIISVLCFSTACDFQEIINSFMPAKEHVCVFDRQLADKEFLAKSATCKTAATYYYSCECGKMDTIAFTSGNKVACSFENYKFNNDSTCESNGTETASCAYGCGKTVTRVKADSKMNHTYGNWVSNGDGTHSKICINNNSHRLTMECSGSRLNCDTKPICDVCNEEFGSTIPHNFSVLFDETGHWFECDCGEETSVEEHVYSEYYDLAECSCSVSNVIIRFCYHCGYIPYSLETETNANDYVLKELQAPTCEEDGFIWYQCKTCQADVLKTDIPALSHTLSGERFYDVELENQCYYEVCQVESCQKKIYTLHDYSIIGSNDDEHWHICAECSKTTDVESHYGGTATCISLAKCTICNVEYGSLSSHDYNLLKYNETSHWNECVCGKKTSAEEHIYSNVYEISECQGTAVQQIRFCYHCGYVVEEGITSTNKHDYNLINVQIPACEEEGFVWYQCKTCNEDILKTDIPALSHLLTGGKIYDVENDNQCYYEVCQIESCKKKVYTLHDYSIINSNASKHWLTCAECSKTTELESHYGGTATCTNLAKCTICDVEYGSLKAHNYNLFKNDETSHWYECVCGGKININNHIPGPAATEETSQVCTVCNYTIKPALGHIHTLHLTKVDAVSVSCTNQGNIEYYSCSCGKFFTDNTAAVEIPDKTSVIIPQLDHEYTEQVTEWKYLKQTATCNTKAEYFYSCVCGKAGENTYTYGDFGAHKYVYNNCVICGEKDFNNAQGYVIDGNYAYFGKYPQSVKEESVLINNTVNANGYYEGSDGEEYVKIVANPNKKDYQFSTSETVNGGSEYYFKLEPIRWRIILDDSEGLTLMCDSIIDTKRYDDNSNNYKNSEIRNWLNNQFYNSAFNDIQRNIILGTNVDNSVASTGYPTNSNVCANTFDKIYMLSYLEANKLSNRKVLASDYSIATGVAINTDIASYGNGAWWLRSPHSSTTDPAVRYIGDDGVIKGGRNYGNMHMGIVPVLRIKIEKENV